MTQGIDPNDIYHAGAWYNRNGRGGPVQYEYDASGNVTGLVGPDGSVNGFPYIRINRDADAIYGKRGGTLDAGTVIQLALDDAYEGATNAKEPGLTIPPGTYRCPTGLDMRDRTIMQGAGMAATRLLVPTGITAIRAWVDEQVGEISRSGVRDLMIRYEDESVAGAYHGIHLQSGTAGRVWRFQVHNVQIYGAGEDGIFIEGTTDNSIAECDFRNVEMSHFKNYGIRENAYVYDQLIFGAFFDGAGEDTIYGHRTSGGSGIYHHMHAVACGTNDAAGTITGGSFYVDSNYNQYFGCHSDRPAGNGFVVGYGSSQLVSNDFTGCLSFNPGVTYSDIASGIKVGACWKIGKAGGLHIIGGQTGGLGSTYSSFSKKGFLFESSQLNGVVISNQTIKTLNQYVAEVGASVPTGVITFRDNYLRQNTGTRWSDESKLNLFNNEIQA